MFILMYLKEHAYEPVKVECNQAFYETKNGAKDTVELELQHISFTLVRPRRSMCSVTKN